MRAVLVMDFYPVGRKDIAGGRAPHGEAFALACHVDEEIGRRLQFLPVNLNRVKELDVVLRSAPACANVLFLALRPGKISSNVMVFSFVVYKC